MTKVGFIGIGNMGGALATSASAAENIEIYVSDFRHSYAEVFADKINGTATDNLKIAELCDVIFFGVKPDGLETLADEIKEKLKARKNKFMIVSMLAGRTLTEIENAIDMECPIVRILPNVPVMVGEGLIQYKPNKVVSDENLELFKKIMEPAGRLSMQEEELIAAGAGVAGCGPAFAAMFIEALADGGVACGLSRTQAIEYAAQMAKGTAVYILEKGIHPDALKDTVTSPGGTTIQGVRTLEKNGFRSALFEAVVATVEADNKL